MPEEDIAAEPAPSDGQSEIAEVAHLFPAYEMLAVLGRGGMGVVYQGRQVGLNRLVAIKLLPTEISANPDFAERFRQEAQAMARLNHPNIVSVYDFGRTEEGHLFFVMECVDGSNLSDVIREVGLNADQALSVAGQICAALGYAHGKGVVHRDVKPANVMIDRESNVKVADFGLARLMDNNGEAVDGVPGGLVFGTPDYMAPEQMRDMDVDHRADIYSLGVMTYEMLCGEVPRGVFLPPSQRVGCDARIDRIVFKAMQQSADLRYQSTEEMEADLTAARTPLPLPPPTVARAKRPVQSQPSVRPAGVPGAIRPRAHSPMPVPTPQGSSLGWVWIGLAVCGAVGALLYYAPWEKPADGKATKHAPASVAETSVPATPTPAPATPAPVAVKPENPPPSEETTAKPAPKPQTEVEKWLADTDAQQQEAFQKQVIKPYEAGVAGLRARYLAALDAGIAKASAAGRLDQALAWRNERQGFADTQTLLTNDVDVVPDIRVLRTDYRNMLARLDQQRAERATALHATYDSLLLKYITLLTQRQRLDDAVLLETKRKEIAGIWLKANAVAAVQKPPPAATPTPTPAADRLPTTEAELRKYLIAWDWVKVKDGRKLEFASDGENASVTQRSGEIYTATYRVTGKRNLTMNWSTKAVQCELNDDCTEVRELSASKNVFTRTNKPTGATPSGGTAAGKPAPAHTSGGVSLLDLKPESSEVGDGEVKLGGFAYLGGRVVLNGEPCEKWIGASAPSRFVYKLPLGIKGFSATGVCTGSNSKKGGAWVYVIKVDGKELHRSPEVDGSNVRVVAMDVNIPVGSKTLELIVDNRGNDWKPPSVWALPMLWK